MFKKTFLTVLIALLLASCVKAEIPPTPTSTPIPTASPIPSPIPSATPTEDPLAGAPEGTTGKNSSGEWVKTVNENGYTYKYTWNSEQQRWERSVANFPLEDWPYFDSIPFKILITDGVPGERNLIRMTHKDFTVADIPPSGIFDPPPLTGVISFYLRERYFVEDTRQLSKSEQQRAIQMEMRGDGEPGHEQAYISIILSNGEEARVKLSQNTGIILTIMTPDTIKELGGDRVSQWSYNGVLFYSEVYDIDENGNMLARLALDGSWNDNILWEEIDTMWKDHKITEAIVRVAIFSIPANFVKNKDQRDQGPTTFGKLLVLQSNELRSDGKTKELEIERVPTAEP